MAQSGVGKPQAESIFSGSFYPGALTGLPGGGIRPHPGGQVSRFPAGGWLFDHLLTGFGMLLPLSDLA